MIARRVASSRRSTAVRLAAVAATLGLIVGGSAVLATSAAAEPGKGSGPSAPAKPDKPAKESTDGSTGGDSGSTTGGNGGGQEVCPGLDSGKIDVSGGSVTATAPEGKLISGYCVKAGSDVSTSDGAVSLVKVDPPAKTVTITHYSGKQVSHYSLSFVDEPKTYTGSASGSGSLTICVDGKNVVATWSATTTGTGDSQAAADQAAKDALPAALATARAAELAKYSGYTEGECKGDFEGSANGSGSMGICYGGANVSVTWSATTVGFGITQELADANAAALLPAALQAAKDAELAKYPGYAEGACSGSAQAQASGSGSLAICLDDQDIPVSWSAATTGFGADQGAAEADAQAKLPAALDAARAAELGKYAGYTEGSCATGATVVQPATVAVPAPATVAVPAAATLPAAVPAGEGSDSGLPMWALAMIAVGMIGAAAAGTRALGARQ